MKFLHMLLSVFFVFGVVACPDEPPPPPVRAAHLGARVDLAAGDVWLQSDNEAAVRIGSGEMLVEGASLKTDAGARALVRLNSGAGVFLRGKTSVAIHDDRVMLQAGELWADVPELSSVLAHFDLGEVQVSATATGMDILKDGDRIRVYVARGLAIVECSGGRVEVSAGEQVEVSNGEPTLSPVTLFEDWTGGMADRSLQAGQGSSASGRIYGIDRANPGSPPSALQIVSQQIRAIIREGVAYTTVDQTFFNSAGSQVEGWYWFTVPEGASVVRFAWEVNGRMVDGKVVERNQAAASYEEAVARAMDPALLEWIDARTCRARIFPIPAAGNKRILLAYTELLPVKEGVYRYIYPMLGNDPVQVQEFSLEVDLGVDGGGYEISTLQDARVSADGQTVSMRRSGYMPRSDFLLELKQKAQQKNVRVMRYDADSSAADYVMLRYTPAVNWKEVKEVPGDVVVVVDTSAGGDSADHQIRLQTAEAILRALGETDRFAVMAADLTPQVLYPRKGLAKATESNISSAVEKMAEIPPAGATDLGEMFSSALALVHDSVQPAIVYVGDGIATSGETVSDAIAERLRRVLGNSRARLFTIAVGDSANHGLLKRLAEVGGGRMFRIDLPAQVVQESLRIAGQLKTPTITELHVDAGAGLDQVFVTHSGKLSEGEELVLLARTHHQFPAQIVVKGSLAGKPFTEEYKVDVASGGAYSYIPSLWARKYVDSLMGSGAEENRGQIISLGLQYGLMTPYSSFLVLENQQPVPPGYLQSWRSWSENLTRRQSVLHAYTPDAREVLSIPLFGFGCSENKAEAPSEVQMNDMLENKEQIVPGAAPLEMAEAGAGAPPAAPAREHAPSRRAMADDRKNEEGNVQMARTDAPGATLEESGKRRLAPVPENRFEKQSMTAANRKASMGTGAGIVPGTNQDDDAGGSPMMVAATRPTPFQLDICSDVASRPLRERRLLWAVRLNMAKNGGDMLRIFREAGQRCELATAHQRRVLLDLIADRATSAEVVRSLLMVFNDYPLARTYLQRRIRRAFLDADSTMGLYFGGAVNWTAVKTGLAALKTPEARLEKVRQLLALHPEPEGRELLVSVLVENGRNDEARQVAQALHRSNEASPATLILLCDLLALQKENLAARRICSELVEFNAEHTAARQKLGDIFLRHGWYDDAYRQYATLVMDNPDDAVSSLKLALAAAGMGKTDEALRLARKVAGTDGEFGAEDPRPWAQAFSVALLARLLYEAHETGNKSMISLLEGQLKRTGMFVRQKQMRIVMWEDFELSPASTFTTEDAPLTPATDIRAPQIGLRLVDLGQLISSSVTVQLVSSQADVTMKRNVPVLLIDIHFDGDHFDVKLQKETVINT